MDTIKQLTELDYGTLIIGIAVVALTYKSIYEFIMWFIGTLGLETKKMRQNREEHELLITTVKNLELLQSKQSEDVRQSIIHDKKIKEDIQKLSKMFIDLEIQDIRWNILTFCSDLSNGKKFSSEYYDYVFKLYDKYEKMLKENDMTNGLVEQSISYIQEKYHESLQEKNKH